MWSSAVFPVDCLVSLITLVTSIAQTAPMGVGTLCSTITELISILQTKADNTKYCTALLEDIKALCPILKQINQSLCEKYQDALSNLTTYVKSISQVIQSYTQMGFFRQFINAKSYQNTIQQNITNFQNSKLTLSLALNTNPTHIIPGSNPIHRSACTPFKDLTEVGDNQCMIIKPSGLRCNAHFPKYALVATNNTIYHTCGDCAKKTKNAWWKYSYNRMELRC